MNFDGLSELGNHIPSDLKLSYHYMKYKPKPKPKKSLIFQNNNVHDVTHSSCSLSN